VNVVDKSKYPDFPIIFQDKIELRQMGMVDVRGLIDIDRIPEKLKNKQLIYKGEIYDKLIIANHNTSR
jgi:hypothetical protein